MGEPVALATTVIEALDRGDVGALRALVPPQYWDWLDAYLQDTRGWRAIEELAGSPRRVTTSRPLSGRSVRVTIEGPHGQAFVTATFDDDGVISGFALEAEDFEGIGTVVICCPADRVDELRAFYAGLVGEDLRRRPRLHFDEGRDYQPPDWPDPDHPQQMHLDIHVRDLAASDGVVRAAGARLLAATSSHRVYADPIGHPFCLYPGSVDGLWRVVIDCPDPAELAGFYATLLGGDTALELGFQEVSPYRPPRWPDPAFSPQMHFDVKVDDRAGVEARIEVAGAVRLPPQGGSCPVFADPAGHPFCLCLHGE